MDASPSSPTAELLPAFRFSVTFLSPTHKDHPMDTWFQRVSGLSRDVQTVDFGEGGQNLYQHRVPDQTTYGNLVLERGRLAESALADDWDQQMTTMAFRPTSVIVILLGENRAPLGGWMFRKAFPVRWSSVDLDASQTELLIETVELAYSDFRIVKP